MKFLKNSFCFMAQLWKLISQNPYGVDMISYERILPRRKYIRENCFRLFVRLKLPLVLSVVEIISFSNGFY